MQLRLHGSIVIHIGEAVARQHWEQVGLAVQNAYRISLQPGAAMQPSDPMVRDRQRHAESEYDGFENFAALAMSLDEIDWLQVTEYGGRRGRLRRKNNWSVEPIAP